MTFTEVMPTLSDLLVNGQPYLTDAPRTLQFSYNLTSSTPEKNVKMEIIDRRHFGIDATTGKTIWNDFSEDEDITNSSAWGVLTKTYTVPAKYAGDFLTFKITVTNQAGQSVSKEFGTVKLLGPTGQLKASSLIPNNKVFEDLNGDGIFNSNEKLAVSWNYNDQGYNSGDDSLASILVEYNDGVGTDYPKQIMVAIRKDTALVLPQLLKDVLNKCQSGQISRCRAGMGGVYRNVAGGTGYKTSPQRIEVPIDPTPN